MRSLRMLIGADGDANGGAERGRGPGPADPASQAPASGRVKQAGPAWLSPRRPLVNQTRRSPANGVENCENDGDRGRVASTGPQGIRVNAIGLAPPTECDCRFVVVQEVSAPATTPVQRFCPQRITRPTVTTRSSDVLPTPPPSRAAHAVAAVVAEITVPVADRD